MCLKFWCSALAKQWDSWLLWPKSVGFIPYMYECKTLQRDLAFNYANRSTFSVQCATGRTHLWRPFLHCAAVYSVALCSIFPSMGQWRTEHILNVVTVDIIADRVRLVWVTEQMTEVQREAIIFIIKNISWVEITRFTQFDEQCTIKAIMIKFLEVCTQIEYSLGSRYIQSKW